MPRFIRAEEVKAAYNEARKKYKKLPTFENMNNEFEIIRTEYPEFILRECRRVVMHVLQSCANNLQPIFNPHPQDPHSMVEAAAFSKDEKQNMFVLYKQFWYWIHTGLEVGTGAEKDEVDFLVNSYKAWPKLKKEYGKILAKVTKEWKKKETKSKEDKGYLG
jgi:hypothetical protein